MVMMNNHTAKTVELRLFTSVSNNMAVTNRHRLFLTIWLLMQTAVVFSQATVSDSSKSSIDQRLKRIEQMLQGQGLLDMLHQLEQLQAEISQLRGEIETQNYNLDQLNKRQRDLYTDLDKRIQRLGNGTTASATVNSNNVTSRVDENPPLETLSATSNFSGNANLMPSESSLQVEIIDSANLPPSSSVTGSPTGMVTARPDTTQVITSPVATTTVVAADPVQLQAEYQQAFNLLNQSLYDQAIKAFQKYLTAHPSDKYSDNAQYWLGEAYYVKREFPSAIENYNKVINNHPESQKVGDAHLKIGYSLYELGDLDAAKAQLEGLIQRRPDSTAARLADERLILINTALRSKTTLAN